MIIDANNDVEKYEQKVVAGLNPQKTVYMVFAVGITVVIGVVLHFVFKVNLVLCIYISSMIAVFVVLIIFSEKDGMTLLQRMKKKRGNSNKTIAFVSTENRDTYSEYNDESKVITEEGAQDEFEKMLVMFKRAAIGIVLFIILVVILLVVLL